MTTSAGPVFRKRNRSGRARIDSLVQTIGKYVIAYNTPSGRGEGVGVDESAYLRIVITGLEVIELGFIVVDIATAAQRGDFSMAFCDLFFVL